ncbi:MAG TPA: HD domain-containing phosphohydrolase [Gemmatimonadales bacterium]|nr:HD domain-containing phosphohydrolase [Gemmatimonadales bacterium]
MTDPTRFLTSLGQALATMALYPAGHPARERVVDAAFEQLQRLMQEDPTPRILFIDGEVVYSRQVLRQMSEWEWGIRLADAGIQRLEFLGQITGDEFEGFLTDVYQRLSPDTPDTSTARQMTATNIRYGPVGVRGADTSMAAEAVATATIAYSLQDEVYAIEWMHEEVKHTGNLPLREAHAVVRSLSLAMHSQGAIFLPLLELKQFDQYTTTHCSNVAVLSMGLAEHLGLASEHVRGVGVAGLLHDLGKIRIPKEILVKPGKFTEEERNMMQAHPVEGARIILSRERSLDLAAVVAYEHHVMLNGGGYPALRFQRDCHYASKLVHVCDVYDALRTDRPYRGALPSEEALSYLAEKAGTEFDPDLVRAFTVMIRERSERRLRLDRPTIEPETPPL